MLKFNRCPTLRTALGIVSGNDEKSFRDKELININVNSVMKASRSRREIYMRTQETMVYKNLCFYSVRVHFRVIRCPRAV